MAARSSPPTCVFCGREIRPDEPSSGRPPMAAHASCADAALADDRHWDDVASHGTDAEQEAPPEAKPAGEPARSGCLPVLAVGALAVALVLGRAVRRTRR